MDTDAAAKYPAQAAGWPWTWPRVRSSTLEQRLLSGAWAVLFKRGPCRNLSILAEVRPLTGEPDAGDPHVRFGGRGSHKLSLPLSNDQFPAVAFALLDTNTPARRANPQV